MHLGKVHGVGVGHVRRRWLRMKRLRWSIVLRNSAPAGSIELSTAQKEAMTYAQTTEAVSITAVETVCSSDETGCTSP